MEIENNTSHSVISVQHTHSTHKHTHTHTHSQKYSNNKKYIHSQNIEIMHKNTALFAMKKTHIHTYTHTNNNTTHPSHTNKL